MAMAIRNLVSKKKRRFQSDGYDLDLAYITPQLIAMGFPSEGLERFYRNPLPQVQQFMNDKHPKRYKIYNLCCERTYPASNFQEGQVALYGFKDHNAPPFSMLARCIQNIEDWLSADRQRVAAVHCKAGKGRTGVVICCYLVKSDIRYRHADAALNYYGEQRTHNSKGVTIPSQRRYCRYFARALAAGCLHTVPDRQLYLTKVICHPCPDAHAKDARLKIWGFAIAGDTIEKDELLIKHDTLIDRDKDNSLVFEFPEGFPVRGDFNLSFKHRHKDKPFMHCWIHTGFVTGNSTTLTKSEIDGPHKDKKHGCYSKDFTIRAEFCPNRMPPEPAVPQMEDLEKGAPALQAPKPIAEPKRSSTAFFEPEQLSNLTLGGEEEGEEDSDEDSMGYEPMASVPKGAGAAQGWGVGDEEDDYQPFSADCAPVVAAPEYSAGVFSFPQMPELQIQDEPVPSVPTVEVDEEICSSDDDCYDM